MLLDSYFDKSKSKKGFIFRILFVYVIGLMFITIMIHFLETLFPKAFDEQVVISGRTLMKGLFQKYGLLSIPIMLLLVPIVEEVMYRLVLVNSLKNRVLTFLGIVINCLIFVLIHKEISKVWGTMVLINVFPLILLFIAYCFKSSANRRVVVFWTSILMFALAHLQNYSSDKLSFNLGAILFIIPQFLMGYLLGKMRLRCGMLYAIGLHLLINLPSIIFLVRFS